MPKEDQILFECAIKKNIGEYVECEETRVKYFEFSVTDILTLMKDDLIIDGSEGGLITTDLKTQNCVFVFEPVENNRYRYTGFQIPGAYITSYLSFKDFKSEYEAFENDIDNFIDFNPESFTVPEDCKIIEIQKPLSIILLSGYRQFIFSKSTVYNHINRIVEIEKQFYK
ncbi:hypothetical protein [Planktosalinus lacus]|uniref:Uncharacterized protein n=1 Tax=Planktosalinus lacus TaxID=1526573 RepID=A0A8J2V7Z6_9FLAO|nr:hypothetical protein [Planktosalinus lacus]GGD85885.1 hypothetical protein GCM10011312_07370 [Planktosalinus lacus]